MFQFGQRQSGILWPQTQFSPNSTSFGCRDVQGRRGTGRLCAGCSWKSPSAPPSLPFSLLGSDLLTSSKHQESGELWPMMNELGTVSWIWFGALKFSSVPSAYLLGTFPLLPTVWIWWVEEPSFLLSLPLKCFKIWSQKISQGSLLIRSFNTYFLRT